MRGALLLPGGLLAAAMTCSFIVACGPSGPTTSGAGGSGGQGGSTPTTGFSCSGKKVSYETDVAPILAAHCAGVEGCHEPMHDATAAYASLVMVDAPECKDGRKKIDPGHPEQSYALQKMTDTGLCAGTPMPKSEGKVWNTRLPDPMIQTVYDWVCQGAKKD